jgi:hypothetical protein
VQSRTRLGPLYQQKAGRVMLRYSSILTGGLAQAPAIDDRRRRNVNWSSRLSEQYHLNLPADVVAWFDGEFWKDCSETGFGQPVHVPKEKWTLKFRHLTAWSRSAQKTITPSRGDLSVLSKSKSATFMPSIGRSCGSFAPADLVWSETNRSHGISHC